MVEHRNVVAYLHAFFHEFDIHQGHTVIQLASYTFDVFVEEVYPVLLRGGKTVIPGPDELMDIRALSQLIRIHKVNFIDCTPLLLNEFNKVGGLGPFDIIISGGDVLKGEYVDNLLKAGKVYNTYGPTETTVCATYYPYYMYSRELKSRISIPIGRPISNYRVYVLDEHLKLQPVGVVGELCVGGVGVVRGYLNRPELTAEKFVSVSYRSYKSYRTYIFSNSKKIYKTGDMARWLPDGNIEFVGRKDTQVKIRGFRIELGEIENRLLAYAGITQSAVIAGTDEKGDRVLIAYVIADSEVDGSDLKDFLAGQLPVYMIPPYFVRLDRIPLTPNGKVNVKALPEPEVISEIEYVEPQNRVQERIQKIWQEVIGVERIGIYDNFFDIGGHSLRGIQVVNALHSEFDVKVPLAEIFRTPTIKGLAEYIENAEEDHYVSIEIVCL
jgi:acyl-coenzyme A synthetase/AMP-(fatty) acid ligase/acyl carrier protein